MIIHSLLDTDLYKFTMMQVVLHQFPSAQVEYKFKCRNSGVQLAPYVEETREEIRHLCKLRFSEEELGYLRALRFIKSDFVDFLGLFKLNEKYVSLAIINEMYFRNTQSQPDVAEGYRRRRDQRPRGQNQGGRTCQLRRPAPPSCPFAGTRFYAAGVHGQTGHGECIKD